jgi:hypothetical protein
MHKYGERKTTQIMIATVRHVTSSSGLTKILDRWIFVRLTKQYGRPLGNVCTKQYARPLGNVCTKQYARPLGNVCTKQYGRPLRNVYIMQYGRPLGIVPSNMACQLLIYLSVATELPAFSYNEVFG